MQHNTTRSAVVAITVTFRNKYMQAENADAIPAVIPQDELGSVHPQHLRLPLLTLGRLCVASKNVALSALGKRRMKNVDEDIEKNNKQ